MSEAKKKFRDTIVGEQIVFDRRVKHPLVYTRVETIEVTRENIDKYPWGHIGSYRTMQYKDDKGQIQDAYCDPTNSDMVTVVGYDESVTLSANERVASARTQAVLALRRLATFQALGQYLSDYNYKDDPASLDPASVIDAIYHGCSDEDEVLFWEPFENYDGEELAKLIEDTRDSILESYKVVGSIFKEYLKELTLEEDMQNLDLSTWITQEGQTNVSTE